MARSGNRSGNRVQVNLRLREDVVTRLEESGTRQGLSRNALIERYVRDGLDTDDDTEARMLGGNAKMTGQRVGEKLKEATSPQPVDGIEARTAVAEAIAEKRRALATDRRDEPMATQHYHRYKEVPETRHPGRLLGTVEAEFECECGKSKMELVKAK